MKNSIERNQLGILKLRMFNGSMKIAYTITKLNVPDKTIQYTKATRCCRLKGFIVTPKEVKPIEHAMDRFKPKVNRGTIGWTNSCNIAKISSENSNPMSKKDNFLSKYLLFSSKTFKTSSIKVKQNKIPIDDSNKFRNRNASKVVKYRGHVIKLIYKTCKRKDFILALLFTIIFKYLTVIIK